MVLASEISVTGVRDRIRQSAVFVCEGTLHRLTFRAMSTECRVNVHGVSAADARAFQELALDWVAAFEAQYSRFIPESLVSRINTAAGEHWVEVDPDTERILNVCQDLFFFTQGAFDPTALPLIRLWNWKANPAQLPTEFALAEARRFVGWNKVQRRPGGIFLPQKGMSIDLGGIGKEYAVDCVVNLALERGIPNFLVDFGNDLRVMGRAPGKSYWHIGLQDAANPSRCWTGVGVGNHAVATSGDYIRHAVIDGRRYGHIVDPRTGYPVSNECRAVSVIAPTCTIAGLFATTVFILGVKQGLPLIERHPGAAGAVTTDATRIFTRNFHEYIPQS
jgi:thiamine biosynthesis lipoprotein